MSFLEIPDVDVILRWRREDDPRSTTRLARAVIGQINIQAPDEISPVHQGRVRLLGGETIGEFFRAYVRLIGPDYDEPAGERLRQGIQAAIDKGQSTSISFADYNIRVPDGWKLELTAPPPPTPPALLDVVTDAINSIDGLTVVDAGNPSVQIDLPMAVVYYAGHDRPTNSDLKERVMVDVLVDWAVEEGVQSRLSQTAKDVIATLEALPSLRLVEVSDFVAVAVPSDPNAEALALQFVVIEA